MDMGIACSSTSAQHMATLKAIAPACTPAEAHAPSSYHPHMWLPQPLELSSEVQKAGDICLKQTSFPSIDVCLNIDGRFPPLQICVNLKQTQALALQVTPKSSSTTFSMASAMMQGSGESVAQHPSRCKNT